MSETAGTNGQQYWAGVYPACLTMFDEDGAIDLDATGTHMSSLIDLGAHGLVVGGTSGEFIALSEAERRDLIEVAVSAAAGRVPVLAGTGYFSSQATIELTRFAQERGADGALVVLPYFQRPNRLEVLTHYRRVASATSLPIVAYNNASNSAAPRLQVDDLLELVADDVIVGVKAMPTTLADVANLVAHTSPSFRIFCGGATPPLTELLAGAHGWISGILNVVPKQGAALFQAVDDGDLAGMARAVDDIVPYLQLATGRLAAATSDLAVYRGVLRVHGLTAAYCRAPLRDLDADEMRELEATLAGAVRVPLS